MSAVMLGGVPFSQVGALQVVSRPPEGIDEFKPRIGGWAMWPELECAFVEAAGLAVPANAINIGGLAFTQDGALYITEDDAVGTFYDVNGKRVRSDGAVLMKVGTPVPGVDYYKGGWAFDGATQAAFVGGAGEAFSIDFDDLGAGEVNTVPTLGAVAATFTRATTATTIGPTGLVVGVATGVPRSYYDPTTLEYLGYLAEGARTNLLLRSEEFDNASWTKTDTTVTANAIVAPDGATTADLLTQGVAGTSLIVQSVAMTANANYAISRWFKAGTGTFIYFSFEAGGDGFGTWFNIQTASLLTGFAQGTAALVSREIKAYPNGWYRVTIVGSLGGGVTGGGNYTLVTDGDNSLTRVNNATRYEWGAQFEDSADFASSYIPTTTAAVTRNADVLTYPTTGWLNASAGTMFAQYSQSGLALSTSPCVWGISNAADFQDWFVSNLSSPGFQDFRVDAASVTQATIRANGSLTTNTNKGVSAWALNDFAVSLNGSTVVTDISGTIPVVDILNVGGRGYDGGQHLWSPIRRVSYFPARLADASLQELTA